MLIFKDKQLSIVAGLVVRHGDLSHEMTLSHEGRRPKSHSITSHEGRRPECDVN